MKPRENLGGGGELEWWVWVEEREERSLEKRSIVGIDQGYSIHAETTEGHKIQPFIVTGLPHMSQV